jgi:hypothetical protein
MTLTARGTITIGSVQLTSDPDVYEPASWSKRASEHPTIGGGLTIQEFGRYAKDLTVHLASGQNQFLTQSVVASLDTMHATKGATYALTDWLGNEFTIWIRDWHPVPTRLPSLWTYDLVLRVMSITKLRGASYSGS